MKSIKIFSASLLTLALVAFLSMSFTTEHAKANSNTVNIEAAAPGNNTCCPPNWLVTPLFPNDPAAKWDNNGDGLICFKASAFGTGTPNGNGNDPAFDESNVKDNNNPCKD